jgi:hypothetical protein
MQKLMKLFAEREDFPLMTRLCLWSDGSGEFVFHDDDDFLKTETTRFNNLEELFQILETK